MTDEPENLVKVMIANQQRDWFRIPTVNLALTAWLLLSTADIKAADLAIPENQTVLDGPILKQIPTWSETLRAVVLTAIPDKYEDNRHWDKTNEIFDGFRVKQRGFDVRISERKRTVKHGAWHRYKIELIEPAKNPRAGD